MYVFRWRQIYYCAIGHTVHFLPDHITHRGIQCMYVKTRGLLSFHA